MEDEDNLDLINRGGMARPAKVSQKILDLMVSERIRIQDESTFAKNYLTKIENKESGLSKINLIDYFPEKTSDFNYTFEVDMYTNRKGSVKMLKALGRERYGKDYEKHLISSKNVGGTEMFQGFNLSYLIWPSKYEKMIDEVCIITPKQGGSARLYITLRRSEREAYEDMGFFDQQVGEIYERVLELSKSLGSSKKFKGKIKSQTGRKKSRRLRRDRRYSKWKTRQKKRLWP